MHIFPEPVVVGKSEGGCEQTGRAGGYQGNRPNETLSYLGT